MCGTYCVDITMNERIKELIKQAESSRLEYNPATMMTERIREFDKEKFAELIVQECVGQIKICAEQIRNDEGYREDNFWPIFANIVDDVAADVKIHFGVEE
jgi:hypothetical protein